MDFSQMSLFELIEFLQKNNLDEFTIKKFAQSFYKSYCETFNKEMCPLIFTDSVRTKGNYTVVSYYDYDNNFIVISNLFFDEILKGNVSIISLLTTIVHEQQHHTQKVNTEKADKASLSDAEMFVALSCALLDEARKISLYEFKHNYVLNGSDNQIYQEFEQLMLKEKKWHAGYGALPIEVDARNSALQFLEMLSKKYPNEEEYKRVFQVEKSRSAEIFNNAQFYFAKELAFADEMIKVETNDSFMLKKREKFKEARKEFFDFLEEQKTKVEECENLSKKFFPLATISSKNKSINNN